MGISSPKPLSSNARPVKTGVGRDCLDGFAAGLEARIARAGVESLDDVEARLVSGRRAGVDHRPRALPCLSGLGREEIFPRRGAEDAEPADVIGNDELGAACVTSSPRSRRPTVIPSQ
jgi:hypothetical protein